MERGSHSLTTDDLKTCFRFSNRESALSQQARIIHDGSSRNGGMARDKREERGLCDV